MGKDAARRLRHDAEKIAPLTEELKELFSEMPATLDELDEAIEQVSVKKGSCFWFQCPYL